MAFEWDEAKNRANIEKHGVSGDFIMSGYNKPLTADELAALPDHAIDFSDIPELDEQWFEEATVVTPEPKERITIRVDRDVLDYFKAQGRGYQSRMNAVLRAFVSARRRRES